jgi:dihydrofolate reductase
MSGSQTPPLDPRPDAPPAADAPGPGHAPALGPHDQRLTLDLILSLDGSAAGEGWPGWWGLETPEYLDWLAQQEDSISLMGANTYRLMSRMSQQAQEVEVSEDEKASFAQLADAEQIVFSSTLSEPLAWPGTRLISTDAVAAVRELKRTADKPLVIMGSIDLGHSLLRAGVVDRFRVVLFPVITGSTGLERIWDRYADFALELVESRTFEGGIQLLEYVPTPLDASPGTAWER